MNVTKPNGVNTKMKTLRQALEVCCEENGWETCEESLVEVVTDYLSEVWKGDYDEHRWYTCYDRVVELPCKEEGPRYISYEEISFKNECNSREDIGRELTVESFTEVFSKEVTTTIYTTTK